MKKALLFLLAFLATGISIYAQGNLQPVNVTATNVDGTNVPEHLFDGDPNTRWSALGNPEWVIIDLGSAKSFDEIQISYFKGDQRQAYFDLQQSNDGNNWTNIKTNLSSAGTSWALESFTFTTATARYIRYYGKGNSLNNWNSLTEMVIKGVSTGGETQHIPINATASNVDGTNVPTNLYDGSPNTRWSSFGNPQYAVLDLGGIKSFNKLKIAFYKGDRRQTYFDIQKSNNGTSWTNVKTGLSSAGDSWDLETFSFSLQEARYIRYYGKGNSSNAWNSIIEIEVYGPNGGSETLHQPINVTATITDGANVAGNMFDGNLTTRWSGFGNPQSATIDLGSPKSFNELRISFFKGTLRQAYFDIQKSDNGSTWTNVQTGLSGSGTTTELESFPFSNQTARYIRYYGKGNSSNGWNSVNEIQIVGSDGGNPDPDPDPDPGNVTKLVFLFDTAGNQIVRKPPSESTALKTKLPPQQVFGEPSEGPEESDPLDDSIAIFPNPTKGDLAVTWNGEYNNLIEKITVTDIAGRAIPVKFDQERVEAKVDLRNHPTGVYLVSFHLTTGRTIGKKILKD